MSYVENLFLILKRKKKNQHRFKYTQQYLSNLYLKRNPNSVVYHGRFVQESLISLYSLQQIPSTGLFPRPHSLSQCKLYEAAKDCCLRTLLACIFTVAHRSDHLLIGWSYHQLIPLLKMFFLWNVSPWLQSLLVLLTNGTAQFLIVMKQIMRKSSCLWFASQRVLNI